MTQLKIGVVGYCPPTVFDEDEARRLLAEVFDQIVEDFQTSCRYDEVTVISGLADVGVPALAYREARSRGWTTGGVACAKVNDFTKFEVEYEQIVGENWGDESEAFLARCDILVRIGGGKQSHNEVAIFNSRGVVYERELEALPSSR